MGGGSQHRASDVCGVSTLSQMCVNGKVSTVRQVVVGRVSTKRQNDWVKGRKVSTIHQEAWALGG